VLENRHGFKTYDEALDYAKQNVNKFKDGGHLSSGKSLKQIAEMHNVSLAHINEQLAKGLEVEKEHCADFKERTRVAKDHLVENPNYYTILDKAGLKMGGHIQRQELVEKSKKGDTPARDLNNYNDIMDLQADGTVGGDSGLAFAKGGVVYDTTKPKIEKVTIKDTKYKTVSIIGRNAKNVSELSFILRDYLFNSSEEDNWVRFYVNDNTRGSYQINLNRGKKNTVKNVNPDTLGSVNIKRVIDAYTYLVKNYDWTDFFSDSSSKITGQGTTSNKTPLTKQDLLMGKIWIGDDVNLKKKVIEKLEEIGIPFDKKNGNPDAEESIGISIYDFDFVVFKESKEQFDADKRRKEFFPEDLGIDVNNLGASATKPIVSKIRIYTTQKNNSMLANIKDAKSFDEFFTILKGLVKIKDTLQDDVRLMIYDDDNNVKDYDLSLAHEEDLFDLLTDIEAKENLMEGLSANNQELDFKQFFSSSAQPLLTDLKNTKIFVNGDKDLIEKVIKKAEQLGWNDNEAIKGWGIVSAIYFTGNRYVGWLSEEEFKQNISFKEISLSDLGIDVNTSAIANPNSSSGQPFDLTNTKIWIGDNSELSKRVQEKAFELGWRWANNPKDIVDNLQALVFEKEYITTRGFKDNKYDKSVFDGLNEKEIFASDLGIGTSISNLSNERLKLLFELKQIVDKENLQVLPANIESASSKQDDEEFIDLLDEEQLVVTFKKGKVNLNPTDERTSKILFEFLEFQKDFDSFSRKKAQELLSSYIADESKLYTTEFERFEGDLSKAKKDLEDLKKLLPAFQQTKFAPQRALIMSEIKKLNNKITKDGFIFTNELMSSANQLFTPQGLLKYYFDQTTQSPVQPLEPPCNLPTPNGMESKLPISAYFNVRTKQFKSWFGDWEKAYETNNYFDCSKMIDEETKEPKIYYHGVRKYVPNFGQFSNMGQGVVRPYGSFEPPTSFPASYFADNEEYAKFYGGVAKNMPRPSDDYEPFIYKVFLSVKNPLNLLPLGFEASYKDLLDYLFVAYGIKKTASANVLNRINNDMVTKHPVWVYVRNDISLLETIKEYGYDALIQIGDIPTFDEDGNPIDDRSKSMKEEEFLTFYPTQVKSATVLKSFYLDFFKDIRFNKGGYVRI
jgi:hypothetical protein